MPVPQQVPANDDDNDSESETSDYEGNNIVNMIKISEGPWVSQQKWFCLEDCNFIFGSSAEVERLWSIAKKILEDNRKSMEQYVFDVYIYLEINRIF